MDSTKATSNSSGIPTAVWPQQQEFGAETASLACWKAEQICLQQGLCCQTVARSCTGSLLWSWCPHCSPSSPGIPGFTFSGKEILIYALHCCRFVLYKLPKHAKGQIPMLGLEYLYMDALAPQWRLGKYLINMTQGALGQTLQQLYETYESKASDISFLLVWLLDMICRWHESTQNKHIRSGLTNRSAQTHRGEEHLDSWADYLHFWLQ